MDHIERFEDLVLSIKANGVLEDYLLCKLFPYSLGGEATSWLKQLKAGCLKTWRSIQIAFLNNFYDDSKSEELRNKLSTFTQGPAEAFKAAWVRFKEYQRECPHHGFSEVQLLGTFFRGVHWRYQMALDATSNGNFNTLYPADAIALIENLVCSNSTKNADIERKKIAGAISGNQMANVNAKLDSVHNLLTEKKHVHFAAEDETTEPKFESEEGVFYIEVKATGSLGSHKAISVATGLQGTRVPPTTLQSLLSRRLFLRVTFIGPMVIQLTKPPSTLGIDKNGIDVLADSREPNKAR